MQLVSNFSFTGLPAGVYSYWIVGWAWYCGHSTYYSTSTWIYPTYSSATGAAFLGATVPTAGQHGLMLLGQVLAASGVPFLRRK